MPPKSRSKSQVSCTGFSPTYDFVAASATTIVNLLCQLAGKYGLPRAISSHFSYFYWGPGPGNPEIVITVGRAKEADLRKDFDEVTRAATIRHPHAIFYENEVPIFVCRKPRIPLHELWPSTRDFG